MGTPIDKLIEKTLESKAPDLFQKILEIIDKMQQPSPPPLPPDLPGKVDDYKPPPPDSSNDIRRVPVGEDIPLGPTQPSVTMEMPIDLLELSTFSNPLKRDIKKSGKQKSKLLTDSNTREGTKHKHTPERRGSIKPITVREKEENTSKVSKKGGEKQPAKRDVNQDNNGSVGTKTENENISPEPCITNETMMPSDALNNESESKEEDNKCTEESTVTSPLLDTNTDTTTNVTLDSPVESKPVAVRRRSSRLASLEGSESSNNNTTTSNTKHCRKRKASLDTEFVSGGELDTNEDEPMESSAVIDKEPPPPVHTRSTRKRPVISSDSEDEPIKQVPKRKPGKKHGSGKQGGRGLSPSVSPVTSPTKSNLVVQGDDNGSERTKRSRREKRKRKH